MDSIVLRLVQLVCFSGISLSAAGKGLLCLSLSKSLPLCGEASSPFFVQEWGVGGGVGWNEPCRYFCLSSLHFSPRRSTCSHAQNFPGSQTPYPRVLKKDFQVKFFIMILAKIYALISGLANKVFPLFLSTSQCPMVKYILKIR